MIRGPTGHIVRGPGGHIARNCECCGKTTIPPTGCANLGNCTCCLGWHVTIQFTGVGSLCILGTLLDGSTINEPLYDVWSSTECGGFQLCKYCLIGIVEGDTYNYSNGDCTGTLLSHTTGGYSVELLSATGGYSLTVSSPSGTIFSGGFSLSSLTATPGTTFTVTNTLASGGTAVVTAKECGTDDCVPCCDNIRFQLSGSGGSGCFPIDITLTRSGCIWSGTSGTWTGDLHFDTTINCWRLTLTSSAGCPQLVLRSVGTIGAGCPPISTASWGICTPPDGYSATLTSVSCAPAPACPTDCSSCFDPVALTVSGGSLVDGTYFCARSGCSWSYSDGTVFITLSCADGVWTADIDSPVAGPCEIIATAAVSGGCPTGLTWAVTSASEGCGVGAGSITVTVE